MAGKRTATILYVPDVTKIKIDEVRVSNWCYQDSVQLEDGVRIMFKAGNSVCVNYFAYVHF
jgi:hypothetical protein